MIYLIFALALDTFPVNNENLKVLIISKPTTNARAPRYLFSINMYEVAPIDIETPAAMADHNIFNSVLAFICSASNLNCIDGAIWIIAPSIQLLIIQTSFRIYLKLQLSGLDG